MIAAPPVSGSAHDTFMERLLALAVGAGVPGTVGAAVVVIVVYPYSLVPAVFTAATPILYEPADGVIYTADKVSPSTRFTTLPFAVIIY